jgi:hypothetical protein
MRRLPDLARFYLLLERLIEMKDANMDVTTDWFWEGNVVDTLAHALVRGGWRIDHKADTHSKEQGPDLIASTQGRILIVEAKGYPSTEYRDPRRSSERKRTNPTNQAQQWYSHALLKVVRLQTKHPRAKIALAFPDFPRYRKLFEETSEGSKSSVWQC